jgi:DUF1365 family protein
MSEPASDLHPRTDAQPYFGFGVTRHQRLWPKENSFEVGSVFVRLPMRTLFQTGDASQAASRLACGLFGLNKASPLGFADSDHFERSKIHGSALAALDKLLLAQGITSCTGDLAGAIWLHTFPRVLGYAFKPVSFWFCHDKAGVLRALVAEVHNTFGEQHSYLLHHKDGSELVSGQPITAQKVFHVSPFFPVRGEYYFRWFVPSDSLNPNRSVVRIDYMDAQHNTAEPEAVTLSTSISGRHVAIDFASCLRVLFGYPLNAIAVVLRIHYQALRLWCKGARFYRLPSKPLINVTHSQ